MSALTNFFAPYRLGIEIAVIGALVAGLSFGVHEFLEHERDIGRAEIQARWDKQKVDDATLKLQRETELKNQVAAAVTEGKNREEIIRTLAAGSGNASNSLRNTLAAISGGVPSATVEALRLSTTTLASVLGECQDRYRDLAEKADRHTSDVKTLIQAWPTTPAVPPTP
jgi:hypothetical protein